MHLRMPLFFLVHSREYVKNAHVLLLPSDKIQAAIHDMYEQSAAYHR